MNVAAGHAEAIDRARHHTSHYPIAMQNTSSLAFLPFWFHAAQGQKGDDMRLQISSHLCGLPNPLSHFFVFRFSWILRMSWGGLDHFFLPSLLFFSFPSLLLPPCSQFCPFFRYFQLPCFTPSTLFPLSI